MKLRETSEQIAISELPVFFLKDNLILLLSLLWTPARMLSELQSSLAELQGHPRLS